MNKTDDVTESPENTDSAQMARLCDAALVVLHRTHPLYFLKGPRVTHRNLGMVTHQESTDIYISECIRRFGIWEPTETDFFLDTLEAGDTFIDIGANIGYFSVLAADLVGPTGSVFSFEPDPRNFGLLELNLALNKAMHARAIQAAVSDEQVRANLLRSADNLGDHRLMVTAAPGDSVTVDTVRLDPAIFRPKSGKVVVKMDTQGWEGRIMLGNLDTLLHATHIVFEWSPRWIAETGIDPLGPIDALASAGYGLQVISDSGGGLEPFSPALAREILPRLHAGSGSADNPMYIDIAATRGLATANG